MITEERSRAAMYPASEPLLPHPLYSANAQSLGVARIGVGLRAREV